MKSIIVAVDLLPETSAVLNTAKEFSRTFGAKLYIVHSESIETYINSVISETHQNVCIELIEDIKKRTKEKLSEIENNLAEESIDVESILMTGLTVDNILDEAAKVNAELIIIGSHKHGKLYHFIFGCIHDMLINKSTIPIIIIPNNYKGKQN